MDIDPIIRAVQKELGVEVDGKPGPETWKAIYGRLVPGRPKSAVRAACAAMPSKTRCTPRAARRRARW